jgi:hypothetical protein
MVFVGALRPLVIRVPVTVISGRVMVVGATRLTSEMGVMGGVGSLRENSERSRVRVDGIRVPSIVVVGSMICRASREVLFGRVPVTVTLARGPPFCHLPTSLMGKAVVRSEMKGRRPRETEMKCMIAVLGC